MAETKTTFPCPYCQGQCAARSDLAGTEASCPHCAATIIIPDLAFVSEPQPVACAAKPPRATPRVFAVRYLSDDEAHSLKIADKGQVTVGGHLTLTGTKKGFVCNRKTRIELFLSSIANVTQEGKVVRFVTRTTNKSGKEVSEGCAVRLKSKADAEALASLLPDTITPDLARLIAETLAFDAILKRATPFAYLTYCLLAINIIVFGFMVINNTAALSTPTAEQLVSFGADYGPLTLSGEYWRLMSSVFIHIGIIHLGLNMWVLASVGRLVERLLGNLHFIVLYGLCGLLASMTSLIWNPEVLSAGASGAIFGLFGALGAVLVRQRGEIPRSILENIRKSTVGFVGYNVLYGFANPNIDNAAHVGGLVAGAVLGFVAARPLEPIARKKLLWPRLAHVGIGTAVLLVAAFAVFPRYYAQLSRFVDSYGYKEEAALASWADIARQHVSGKLDDKAFADQIEQQVLPVWSSLVKSGSELKVPSGTEAARVSQLTIQVATLRRDALVSLIDGLRRNDAQKIEVFIELQAEAEQIIAELNKETE